MYFGHSLPFEEIDLRKTHALQVQDWSAFSWLFE